MNNSLDHDVKIAYLGVPDDDITIKLISLFEYYSNANMDLAKLSKKTSVIIAECFQNVIRHRVDEKELSDSSHKDFFEIQISGDGVTIGTQNLVSAENVDLVNSKINLVNSLSSDELKELWRKIIQEGELSEKGGAGLGIVEMARKSGLPLEKKFVQKGNGMYEFFLSLSLKKQGVEGSESSAIDVLESDYNYFTNKNTLLFYQGDFSNDTNVLLIEMLQANFTRDSNEDSRFVEKLTLIIEVMENASKHGEQVAQKSEGSFLISICDGLQKITCSNWIKDEKKTLLEKYLGRIKQLSKLELEQEYKASLKNKLLSETGNAGLGILEIAKITNNKFNYQFKDEADGYSMFSIDLTL